MPRQQIYAIIYRTCSLFSDREIVSVIALVIDNFIFLILEVISDSYLGRYEKVVSDIDCLILIMKHFFTDTKMYNGVMACFIADNV